MIGYVRTLDEVYRRLKIFFEGDNSNELLKGGRLDGIVYNVNNDESFPLTISLNDATQPTTDREHEYKWRLNMPRMLLEARDFIENGIHIFKYTDSNLVPCELTSINVDNLRKNLEHLDIHYRHLIDLYDEFLKGLKRT